MERFRYRPTAYLEETALKGIDRLKSHSEILTILEPTQKEVAAAFFPEDKPVQLNHAGFKSPEKFTNAEDFLLEEAGVYNWELDKVFDAEGKWLPAPENKEHISQTEPLEAAMAVSQALRPLYDMANRSLDTSLPNGFNRHAIDHVASVYTDSQALLHKAQAYRDDIDQETLRINAIAAIGHDVGNMLSRSLHPFVSLEIMKHFLPKIAKEDTWQRIEEAVLLHDEPVLKKVLKAWGAILPDGSVDLDSSVVKLSEKVHPEALALIIADKSQFGRDRVSEKTNSKDGIEKDPHIIANLLMERTTPELSLDGTTYTMKLVYNPFIRKDERFDWAGKDSKRPEYSGNKRVFVDAKTHQQLKEKGIPYSLSVEKKWLEIFEDRFGILLAATFALFPNLQQFQLEFLDPSIPVDKNTNFQKLAKRSYLFKRGQLAETMKQYKIFLQHI